MVVAQCSGPWYFMADLSIPRCCCSRILTTSNGVTITSASVMPEAKPAAIRRPSTEAGGSFYQTPSWQQGSGEESRGGHAPVSFPSLSRSAFW